MLTRDGRFALVYNGELYNFRELRRELEQEDARFCSTGDTEVVLYALAHWGNRALARFNGMFALGFYDSVEKRLLLARDHAGIKPLYYMLTSRGLVFASQYDQILGHPWSRTLDVSSAALALYLRLGYIPAPYALLQNTHMLEPGTWLEVSTDSRLRSGRFFEFHPTVSPTSAAKRRTRPWMRQLQRLCAVTSSATFRSARFSRAALILRSWPPKCAR